MKRPRISAFPKCFIERIVRGEMDVFEWIAMSESLGADGLEMYVPFFTGTGKSYLDRVRRAIEQTGQVCSLLCFSPDFTHPDPSYRAAELEKQKGAIDMAAFLGASCCRTLSGQRRPGVARDDGVRWVVENVRQAAAHAESRGVVLAMENHYKDSFWEYPEFAQQVDVFLEVVEQIETPAFGVQFDPSNAVLAGADPVALLSRIRGRVVSVHASDRSLDPGISLEDLREADGTIGYPEGLRHGAVGEGLIDYDTIFRVLADTGYGGWISIEDGLNGMDEMQRSLDFVRARIDDFYGV